MSLFGTASASLALRRSPATQPQRFIDEVLQIRLACPTQPFKLHRHVIIKRQRCPHASMRIGIDALMSSELRPHFPDPWLDRALLVSGAAAGRITEANFRSASVS